MVKGSLGDAHRLQDVLDRRRLIPLRDEQGLRGVEDLAFALSRGLAYANHVSSSLSVRTFSRFDQPTDRRSNDRSVELPSVKRSRGDPHRDPGNSHEI